MRAGLPAGHRGLGDAEEPAEAVLLDAPEAAPRAQRQPEAPVERQLDQVRPILHDASLAAHLPRTGAQAAPARSSNASHRDSCFARRPRRQDRHAPRTLRSSSDGGNRRLRPPRRWQIRGSTTIGEALEAAGRAVSFARPRRGGLRSLADDRRVAQASPTCPSSATTVRRSCGPRGSATRIRAPRRPRAQSHLLRFRPMPRCGRRRAGRDDGVADAGARRASRWPPGGAVREACPDGVELLARHPQGLRALPRREGVRCRLRQELTADAAASCRYRRYRTGIPI